jgi:hypothetical protein
VSLNPVISNPVASVVDYHRQPALAAAGPAVPTELPVPQAITAAATIPAVRNDERRPERTAPAAPGASRVVIVDPRTDALVFRSLDADTGSVISQVPTQALLRQRAYVQAQTVQALIQGKDLSTAVLAAEQNVDTTT